MLEAVSGTEIDFFGLPQHVAGAERRIQEPGDHTTGAVELAWYLRQREPVRCGELLTSLDELEGADPLENGRFNGRLLLTRAENLRLNARLEEAMLLAARAGAQFGRGADPQGEGDCAFIRAEIHLMQGQVPAAMAELARAASLYQTADDPIRQAIAECRMAYQHQYENPDEAARQWEGLSGQGRLPDHPGVRAYYAAFRGGVAFQRGAFPEAIHAWQGGFDDALSAGMIWLSVQLAMMVGSAFANLYDLSTAMEWKERAYGIAAPTGWPDAIGTSLASMAETTTSLGQHDRARALFEEALSYLGRLNSTRRHVISYNAFGGLCLAMHKPDEALSWFTKGQGIARQLGHPDLELPFGVGVATALMQLGKMEEAAAAAANARREAARQKNPYYEIEAIRVQAAILRSLPRPDIVAAISTLHQAVELGERLDGMTLRCEIFEELAKDHEAVGDFQQALQYERRARESWQRNFDKQNGARLLAMQVRFDTARARAEADYHRQLAEAEAARATELDRANQVLEKMGAIGQEITARLDSEAVFATLSQHLQDLIHINTLFLGLKDEASGTINILYRMEDGRRLPPRQVSLASDTLSARCVRDNDEILVSWGGHTNPTTLPGTRHMRTVLYRPLSMGDRVLGVVSVQSDRPNAYGPRELLIFRTICAYGAIAMANAAAYQQVDRAVDELREALQRLVQQEKMAALGQLVAGVAHEVNTPLGVTLSAVSQLNDNIRLMRDQVANGALTRGALSEHLESGQELAALAQRNVVRAADMVRTFKGVAVDQGSDERRQFELGDYIKEIISLMRARIAANGNKVQLDIPSIHMDTYPGALAQAISNLLANVADHAYEPGAPGTVWIEARKLDARLVEITVTDKGCGIAPDILPKVFDPFFTTRRASGSMGLGLHVAFNQVTQRLNGTIMIDSVPGQGTVATLRIPCEVPGGPPASLPPSAR